MLIGRGEELGECLTALRVGRSLAVVGDAGLGKTTLLEAMASALDDEVHWGKGLATLSWMSYVPLLRTLGGGRPEGDGAAVAHAVVERVGAGVLIVDDLQWVDDDTLRVLELVSNRIRLAVSIRTDDPAASRALTAVRERGYLEVPLAPLSQNEAGLFLRRKRPELLGDEVVEIVARAEGSPLLLEQLSWGGEPSTSLRISVRARIQRLQPSAREALGVLSLVGRPADQELLGGGIDALVASGLAVRTAEGYVARHSLLAEAAADELGPQVRRSIYAAIATRTTDPGERAVHLELAGDLAGARSNALRAAAASAHAGERARMLLIALRSGDGGHQDDALRLRAARALVDAGEFMEADRVASDVRSQDPQTRGEALLYRARAMRGLHGLAAGREVAEQGLAVVEGTGTSVEVELLIELVNVGAWGWRSDVIVPLARKALAAARGTTELAPALRAMGGALLSEGSATALPYLRLAAARAQREGQIEVALDAGFHLVTAMKYMQRWRPSLPLAAEYRREAVAAGLRTWDVMFRWHELTTIADCAGDMERVIELAERLIADIAIPARLVDDAIGYIGIASAELMRLDEGRDVLVRWQPTATGESMFPSVALAELHLAEGEPSAVLDVARETQRRFPDDPNMVVLWLIAGWAWLERAEEPEPYRGVMLPSVEGYLDGLRGQAELVRGEVRSAERSFLSAVDRLTDFDVRAAMRCHAAAGVAIADAGEKERAREVLLDVEQRATALGFTSLLTKLRIPLRALGVPRSAPYVRSDGPLTSREREVLHLVSQGLRTRGIAARLGIDPTTVDAIVRSASTKLQARSRIEAAARLAELDGPISDDVAVS